MPGLKQSLRVSTRAVYGISCLIFISAVGVLRMVKLFGWEHMMSKNLKEKREEELSWLMKDKVCLSQIFNG